MYQNKKALLLACWCGLTIQLYAQQGLLGEYFNGQNFDQKVLTRTDAQINFYWDEVAPAPGIDPFVFSVRWTGKIQAPETGTYLFFVHVDDGVRVSVNGQMIINGWGMHDSERLMGEVALKAGSLNDLKVEYFNGLNEGEIQLFWQLPSQTPVFKGAFGYNEALIAAKYFKLPDPPKVVSSVLPRPAVETAKKPDTKPTLKAKKAALIAKDTLERYLPKNVLFVKSKSILLPESEPELNQLAGFLLRNPPYTLRIEGHTDHIGDPVKNLKLSEERAQTVASYLIQKGIAANRITTKGYGDTRPLVREAEGIPNEKNRRVEFFIQE